LSDAGGLPWVCSANGTTLKGLHQFNVQTPVARGTMDSTPFRVDRWTREPRVVPLRVTTLGWKIERRWRSERAGLRLLPLQVARLFQHVLANVATSYARAPFIQPRSCERSYPDSSGRATSARNSHPRLTPIIVTNASRDVLANVATLCALSAGRSPPPDTFLRTWLSRLVGTRDFRPQLTPTSSISAAVPNPQPPSPPGPAARAVRRRRSA
jgi:hypothetical protein